MYSDDDDDDAEPAIPLLLRDKQGRTVSEDEVQESCKPSDEIVNHGHHEESPEWVPRFYLADPAEDEVAPKNHPDKTAEGVDSKTSQMTSSCEPVGNSVSQEEKSISLTECLS